MKLFIPPFHGKFGFVLVFRTGCFHLNHQCLFEETDHSRSHIGEDGEFNEDHFTLKHSPYPPSVPKAHCNAMKEEVPMRASFLELFCNTPEIYWADVNICSLKSELKREAPV